MSNEVVRLINEAVPQPLIGQGGEPPLVNEYRTFTPTPVGAQFVSAEELEGTDAPGKPSYKVLKYLAAQSGKRGDSLYPLNVVIQRNAGDPPSDQIGVEINVNNNGAPLAVNERNWLDGLAVGSGGETHPGVGVHIGSTGAHNRFVTPLKLDEGAHTTIAVNSPTILIPAAVTIKQPEHNGDTVILQRNNDTHYAGSFLRCLSFSGAELFRIDYDGSVWCRGNKVIG